MQIPCVERPPATPSMRLQGQIASQLHASKYVPLIAHLTRARAYTPSPRPRESPPSKRPHHRAAIGLAPHTRG
jgi:hypothetical protein